MQSFISLGCEILAILPKTLTKYGQITWLLMLILKFVTFTLFGIKF